MRTIIFRIDKQQYLCYGTGNYIQYHDKPQWKEYLKNEYVCITESLCYRADGQTLQINYSSV